MRIPHRWLQGLIAIGWLLLSMTGAALAETEPLRPELAFRYSASAEGSDLVVRWDIEPGYYLYRERMSYAAASPAVELGSAQMPDGIPYHDNFFGDMHIYREKAVVRIPVHRAPDGPLELVIKSQGCADIGLCYPPQTWRTAVPWRNAGSGAASGLDSSSRGGLAALLNAPATGDAPLPAEKVFRVHAERMASGDLRVVWTILPGHYLYRDSLKLRSLTPGVTLGAPRLPPGKPKEDEYWGKTQVYYDEAVAEVSVSGASDPAQPLQLEVAHQGCKEDSICYPPQKLTITAISAIPAAAAIASPAAADSNAPVVVSEQDRFAQRIAGGSLLLALGLAFAAGIGLSLLPCCWPMVPILSGIIVGQGKHVTTARAFTLSLTYVLGMAVVYAAAGAAAAAAGQQVQAAMQTPWIIGGVAALFVAMALSMFGLYELQLPAALTNRLNAVSGRQQAGTFIGTALMGALSALVVSACVAPPLVGVLTFIAQSGDVLRGALALFAMGLGMGLPLLVVGTSGGRLLPKAGAWMISVKAGFGFLMLSLAIWMLDRLMPDVITMVLYAVLAVMAGVFLGAFQPLAADASASRRLAKGAGLLVALYGATLLVGALAGSRNPLQPLAGLRGEAAQSRALEFRRIKSVEDFEQALAAARAAGQPAMLDFYADWCTSCIEMEHYTFTHADVQAALKGGVLLQADVTANDDIDQALLRRFGIFGPPTIVFFGADGAERAGYRVVGFKDAATFAAHVRQAFGR